MAKGLKKGTRFTVGSGCYVCQHCKVSTRDDGAGDSVHLRICSRCYELGGIENLIQDGNADPADLDRAEVLRQEIAARQEAAKAKA